MKKIVFAVLAVVLFSNIVGCDNIGYDNKGGRQISREQAQNIVNTLHYVKVPDKNACFAVGASSFGYSNAVLTYIPCESVGLK